MKAVIIIVLLVLAAVAVIAIGGQGASERPGAASVYAEIESSSSCSRLQEMFDTAADNNDREPAGSRLFDVTLSYMNVADDRLREVGCYG